MLFRGVCLCLWPGVCVILRVRVFFCVVVWGYDIGITLFVFICSAWSRRSLEVIILCELYRVYGVHVCLFMVVCGVLWWVFFVVFMCSWWVGDITDSVQVHRGSCVCWVFVCVLCIGECVLCMSRCLGLVETGFGFILCLVRFVWCWCCRGLVVCFWLPGIFH